MRVEDDGVAAIESRHLFAAPARVDVFAGIGELRDDAVEVAFHRFQFLGIEDALRVEEAVILPKLVGA